MESCIFCNIAKGVLPCAKIWENDNYVAFLDIKPVTKGMTLVVPKEHLTSAIFDNDIESMKNIMEVSKEVAGVLKSYFKSERVALVFEGVDIQHLHAKLYPLREGECIEKLVCNVQSIPDIETINNLAEKIRGSVNKALD